MKESIFLLIAFFLTASCNQSQVSTTPPTNDASSPDVSGHPDKNQNPADMIKLVKHDVMDTEGTGLVAASFLIPADWSIQDKLYWEYRDATLPIRFKANLRSKDGSKAIQIFPDVRAVWSSGPTGASGYRPPADILSGMKDLIASERKGIPFTYVNQKVLHSNAQNTPQGRTKSESGVITIAYEEHGASYEEEFFANLESTYMVSPSLYGNLESIVWAASGMYANKALKGELEGCRKIGQTLAYSTRLNKSFYNRLLQVTQLLSDQVYASIYQAGQISRIISQTNDQMITNIDASYRASQEAYDRTNQQFSDYIRGVDRYSDGSTEIQLPSGYENAWVNDRGEYLLTNAAGFNPAVELKDNWRPLDRH